MNVRPSLNLTAEMKFSTQSLLCLAWASQGKTVIEIAEIEGLSARDAESLLLAAVREMAATSLVQTIKIAKSRKLI